MNYAQIHDLSIHEAGLPAGTTWSVLVNGTKYTTTHLSYELKDITSSTLSYVIDNTSLYYSSVYDGSISFSATNGYVNVSFEHYAYITGDISPTNATVLVNGRSVALHNGAFNISLAAGTYSVKVSAPGYSTHYDNFTLASDHTENVSTSLKRVPSGTSGGLPVNDYVYIGGGIVAVLIVGGVVSFIRRKP